MEQGAGRLSLCGWGSRAGRLRGHILEDTGETLPLGSFALWGASVP